MYCSSEAISEDSKLMPDVIVLSSKFVENLDFVDKFKNCLNSKQTYFLCVGESSESLHDKLDNLFLSMQEVSNSFNMPITTFHSDDSMDEILSYCLFGTGKSENEELSILALLSEDIESDLKLKELLLEEWN